MEPQTTPKTKYAEGYNLRIYEGNNKIKKIPLEINSVHLLEVKNHSESG